MPSTKETRGDHVPGRIGAAESALYGEAVRTETPLFDRLKNVARTQLPRNAIILAILLLAGAGMSFFNLRVLGHEYGAGPELDAWSAATRLPQLALDFLVVGGVVGPFLPLFVGLKGEAADKARDFARTILTLAILVMALAMAIMFVFAAQTMSIVAPGFTGEQRELYIGLFRVLCFAQVIFAASWVLGEILVAERRFVTYGLAEPIYYGGIAAGAVLFSGPLGIYGAAVGAVVGAGAHLGIRLVGIYRTSFRPWPSLALRTQGLGEFLRLMAPKMISQPLLALTAALLHQPGVQPGPGIGHLFHLCPAFPEPAGEPLRGRLRHRSLPRPLVRRSGRRQERFQAGIQNEPGHDRVSLHLGGGLPADLRPVRDPHIPGRWGLRRHGRGSDDHGCLDLRRLDSVREPD